MKTQLINGESDNSFPLNGQNVILKGLDTPLEKQITLPEFDVGKVVYNAVELVTLGNIEPKYLMKPIFPQRGSAVLAGKPDIGKSQLARQLCICVALGEKTFLDFELTPIHNKAIYVTTEDSKEASTYLLSKQFKGLDKEVVENLRFIFADTMEQDEIINVLKKALTAEPADLVVIDSFGDIFTGTDSNNNMSMRNNVKTFDKIGKEHNCLIMFVHHINKGGYKLAPGQEHIQGGSGFVQKVRLAIVLSEGQGNTRYFSIVKGNYCPKEYKTHSLVLDFSEETFLFKNTGETIPADQIGTQPNNVNKVEEKQDELQKVAKIIFDDQSVLHTDFVKQYCEMTDKSESSGKRALKKLVEIGIIEKFDGGYRLSEGTIEVKDGIEDIEDIGEDIE